MLAVPVFTMQGEQTGEMEIDPALLGVRVRPQLMKQAIVAYHANRRQGAAATKSRGQVAGSTKKMFRQKGTGYARRGSRRTNILRGGGMAFGKKPRSFRKKLPRNMRKAALASAILAKMLGEDLLVIDGLRMDAPKTADLARLLRALEINRSCLLALHDRDPNVYLSSRNLPDLTVRTTAELNAFDVAMRRKMLVTSEAMQAWLAPEASE